LFLINDLLDLAKLESGKQELVFLENNLADVVEDSLIEIQSLSQEKNIKFENSLDKNAIGSFDKKLINQVIINLISNAIKYSPENSTISIQVDNKLRMLKGKQVHVLYFSIKDQGIGIPETELSSVFDKFIQSSKTKTNAGGTGLGLPICHEIINYHQGIIWAEVNKSDDFIEGDKLLAGTTLKFLIPTFQSET